LKCIVTADESGSSIAGVPDQCYTYDALGNVIQSGLDLDGNGQLDPESEDRITETVTAYIEDSGVWWQETVNHVYPFSGEDAGTPKEMSRVQRQLTGLGYSTEDGIVVALTRSYDLFPNETISTTTVDRASKLVTQTTNVPGSVVDAETVSYNGLVQETTTTSGLTYTYGYDAIGRRTSTTDPRTGTSTTHYDSAGRVDYVEDACTPPNRTTYHYDPTTGRLDWVMNAGGKYTRFAYNERGQKTHEWGEVPNPTWVKYDDYGQREVLHTYRGEAANWAGTAWPENPGDDDVTTWAYHERRKEGHY
jgi:YD repeat-containing protein